MGNSIYLFSTFVSQWVFRMAICTKRKSSKLLFPHCVVVYKKVEYTVIPQLECPCNSVEQISRVFEDNLGIIFVISP